jgi:hypothetical protein
LITLGILSDIHYASAPEQARGSDYELRSLKNPLLRLLLQAHRRYVWLHEPLRQNHLVDNFLKEANGFDCVVANGDYSCDTAFVGVSDDASCQSARECLEKLRQKFGPKLRAIFGDHELGKVSLFGGQGGMRLESYRRGKEELGLEPFWKLELGNYVLLGVTSSLVGLPVFEPDILEAERPGWEKLRSEHLDEIRSAFSRLAPAQRVLLFCHDPSALPYLWEEEIIRAKQAQIEQTVIGHLHSNLIFWKSRRLAGMPRIKFMGHGIKRMTTALNNARCWEAFKVRLCPALAGIELLKDGGYLTAHLDPAGKEPARFAMHRLAR